MQCENSAFISRSRSLVLIDGPLSNALIMPTGPMALLARIHREIYFPLLVLHKMVSVSRK